MRNATLLVCVLIVAACARSPRSYQPGVLDNEVRVPAVQLEEELGPHYMVETRFRVVGDGKPRTLTAPKLGVKPGQRSHVTVLNQLSFVQDYDAEVTDDAFVVHPIIGILQDGLSLALLVAPVDGDPSSAWLGFDATVADLREPMRKKKVRFTRRGAPGTVQLPKLDLARASGVRRVESGKRVVLADLPAPNGRGRMRLSVSVKAVGDVTSVAVPDVSTETEPPPLGHQTPAEEENFVLGLDAPEVDLRTMVADAATSNADNATVVLNFVIVDAALPKALMPEREARRRIQRRSRHVGRMALTSAAVEGARTSSILQASYIQDYDVIVPKGHKADDPLPKDWPTVADPLIGTVQSGRDAWIERGDDGPKLHVRWAWLHTMPDFHTNLGDGPTVTIELPELRLIDDATELREGKWLFPIGKAIVTGHQGDEVHTAAVWIDYRTGS